MAHFVVEQFEAGKKKDEIFPIVYLIPTTNIIQTLRDEMAKHLDWQEGIHFEVGISKVDRGCIWFNICRMFW
jgi:hypothetical protein